MKHVENIKKLLRTVANSARFHALVVVSPPGWAKSTTVDAVLAELALDHHAIGAYTTPLGLYNAICGHPSKVLVLDDCAGLFGDAKAMALLKAATWASAGGDGLARRVAWNSTSDRVTQGETTFGGKFVLLTNTLPGKPDAQAFFSRSMLYRIQLERGDVEELLVAAARATAYFPDEAAAAEVAEFIVEKLLPECDPNVINLRTLHLGYELRASNPDDWRALLAAVTSVRTYDGTPSELVRELAEDAALSVAEQEAAFCRATGLSRRTFYEHRRRRGLSRPYKQSDLGSDELKTDGSLM